MARKKIKWKGLLKAAAPLIVGVVLGLTLVFGVNSCGENREYNNYKHRVDKSSLPIVAENHLPSDFHLKRALFELNRETGVKLWTLKPKGYKGNVVKFLPAPLEEYKKVTSRGTRGLCHWSNNTTGQARFADNKIYVCIDKLRVAWIYRKQADQRHLRKYNYKLRAYYDINYLNGYRGDNEKEAKGYLGVLKHEAGHWFWPTHVSWGCGLMCAHPSTKEVSKAELRILKKVLQ
jgi:hypothetical protein